MAENNQNCLDELKRMHEEVDWQTEEKRLEFIRQLERWIADWQGQTPNLLDIFRPEEIECLLRDCIKNISEEDTSRYRALVEFVARSGYKDVVSQVDQDGKPSLRRTTPIHLAAERIELADVVRELFQIYNCDTNYSDETGLTHFHVAVQFGYEDVVENFLKLGQDPNIVTKTTGDTPSHMALIFKRYKIVELLRNSGAKMTLANAKGLTPWDTFYEVRRKDPNRLYLLKDEKYPPGLVCGPLKSAASNGLVNLTKLQLRKYNDPYFRTRLPENFYDLWMNELMAVRVFKKFHRDDLAEIAAKLIDLQKGQLLHLALDTNNMEAVKALLRRGADPNSVNARGETALHVIALPFIHDEDIAATMGTFFEVCDALGRQVDVDVRNDKGHTVLHCAGHRSRLKTIELLLRRGADPNLTYGKSSTTLLHDLARLGNRGPFPMMLFEMAKVDARDDEGNTPLHLALRHGKSEMADLLLRNGADPNLADAQGSTALHLVVKFGMQECELVELFFKACDDNYQFVQIDAKDNEGRTPLQWAVAYVKPKVVARLLDRGAELSRFVFPDEDYYGASFDPSCDYVGSVKLSMVSGALLTVEILEDAGYELLHDDFLTIAKFFARHGLHPKSASLQSELWRDDEKAARALKGYVMRPDWPLVDLMRMRPQEAKNLLLFEVWRLEGLWRLSAGRTFHVHLCEKLSRRFFRSWALVSFMQLTHCRLPLECCEMIVDELQKEDLFNICLAAASATVASVTGNSNSDNSSDNNRNSDD